MKAIGLMFMLCILTVGGFCFFQARNEKARVAEEKTAVAYLAGNWLETVAYGKQWATSDPWDPAPHALMNLAYMKLGKQREMKHELVFSFSTKERGQKVLKWANKLFNKHPENPAVYWFKGSVLESLDMLQEAVDTYKSGTMINQSFPDNYENLGNLYLAMDRPDDALRTFKSMLGLCGNKAVAYDHLGTVYLTKKDTAKATECFEKSVEIDPKDLIAQNNLATMYFYAGQKEKLVKTLQKISELDPDGEIGDSARLKLRDNPK